MGTAGGETLEFRHEFVQETHSLLRRRLRNFAMLVGGIWGALTLLKWIPRLSGHGVEPMDLWVTIGRGVNDAAMAAGFIVALRIGLERRGTRAPALVASIGLIAFYGVYLTIGGYGLGEPNWDWFMFLTFHLLASAFFPWTAMQSLIPVGIFVAAHAAFVFSDGQADPSADAISTILWAAVGLPGLLVCSLQHRLRRHRFGYRFVHSRYGKLRDELAAARRIHESLFPAPSDDGAFVLSYQYEPMRQIGGDYLHVAGHRRPDGSELLSVVVVDVTGHGIPAALTVNRLHGEIELLFAGDPLVGPSEVLKHLNRYVHLTLAKHSIYATALCMRFDSDSGVLEVASGGHPPAFLLGVDGSLEEIRSTAFVLGACRDEDFDPAATTYPFHPGDTVIAYTDGATEVRSPEGAMLRIQGLRSLIARDSSRAGDRARSLLQAIASHRGDAPIDDDTLIVEIHRPIGRSPSRVPKDREAQRAGSITAEAARSGP